MCACVCKIRELTMNGQPVPVQDKKIVTTNGKILKSADGAEHPSVVFPTEDPNLTIRVDALDRKAENILTVKMEIVQIPLAVASDMAGAVKNFSKETGNLSIRTSVKQMLVRQQDKSMKQNWQSCG